MKKGDAITLVHFSVFQELWRSFKTENSYTLKRTPKDYDHGTITDVFINFWISQVFLVSFNKDGLETIMGVMTIYEIWGDCPNFSFQSFSKILNNLKGTS
jgi:hypothetical protein